MNKNTVTGRRAAAMVALAGLAVVAAAGCGGGSSGSGSGQLTVLMADAPPAGVKEVNVVVTKCEVHSGGSTDSSGQVTGGSWKTVFEGSQPYNLLALANVQNPDTLPHIVDRGKLPAGRYTQLRLVIDPNQATIKLADDSVHPLVIPSGGNSGLKALPFTIASQQDTVLLLDFDVAQSVNQQGDGTYKLTPVIRVAPLTLTGSVTGNVVDGSTSAPMAATVNLKDAGGNVVAGTVTTVSGASPPAATDGVFALHGIASGSYTLEVSAEGHTTVTQPVTVTAPDTTDAGSVTLTAGP
jgi:uncharacterized protein DUF4382